MAASGSATLKRDQVLGVLKMEKAFEVNVDANGDVNFVITLDQAFNGANPSVVCVPELGLNGDVQTSADNKTIRSTYSAAGPTIKLEDKHAAASSPLGTEWRSGTVTVIVYAIDQP